MRGHVQFAICRLMQDTISYVHVEAFSEVNEVHWQEAELEFEI